MRKIILAVVIFSGVSMVIKTAADAYTKAIATGVALTLKLTNGTGGQL